MIRFLSSPPESGKIRNPPPGAKYVNPAPRGFWFGVVWSGIFWGRGERGFWWVRCSGINQGREKKKKNWGRIKGMVLFLFSFFFLLPLMQWNQTKKNIVGGRPACQRAWFVSPLKSGGKVGSGLFKKPSLHVRKKITDWNFLDGKYLVRRSAQLLLIFFVLLKNAEKY